jgi:hypothetical protein
MGDSKTTPATGMGGEVFAVASASVTTDRAIVPPMLDPSKKHFSRRFGYRDWAY